MSLQTYSRRALTQRPGRTILTILSIVIGVTAIVATTILTQTTRGAYRLMFETVVGRASLEVVAGGGGSFDEKLLDEVAKVPGVKAVTPLVLRNSVLLGEDRQVRLQVLGIDPVRDTAVRDYDIVAGKPLSSGDQLLLDEAFARFLNLKIGDLVRFRTNRGPKSFTLVGLLEAKGSAALTQAGIAYIPIERAQAYFSYRGHTQEIDSIQIVTVSDRQEEKDKVRAAIAKLLPAGVTVRTPGAGTNVMKETLMSSEQGLKLASRFSILLSVFIILNTFMMNVGERRRQLAIMRAIGAKSKEISRMLLVESVMLGTVGTVLGIILGIVVARSINITLSRVMYVNLPNVDGETMAWAIGLGVAVGLFVSIAGALAPARRAAKVSPLEGMSRTPKEDMSYPKVLYSVIGILLIVLSTVLIAVTIAGYLWIDVPIYAALTLFVGLIFLAPLVLGPLASLVVKFIRPFGRVEASLALQQVLRHRGRSTLTIGVLFLAAATGVGMAHAILDSVANVQNWVRIAINGDFFVRALMPDMSSGTSADLPEGMDDEIAAVPGITHLDRITFSEVTVGDTTGIAISRQYDSQGRLPFDLQEGTEEGLREKLGEGQVVMASVLAQRMNKHVGDTVEIETEEGKKAFRIAAVANDYLVGGLGIYMKRDIAQRLLKQTGVDGYVIFAKEQDLDQVKAALQKITDKHDVLLLSNADISRNVSRIVNAVDWCLWALVYLGFVVAAFGVVNTLTMNVLEQTRELGLLRIVAMTKRQLRRTILMQALLIGGVGLAPGVLAGIAVAFVMNMAMEPAFGHPIVFNIHPWLLVGSFVGSLLITALAAYFPARRAARINVVDALHYE